MDKINYVKTETQTCSIFESFFCVSFNHCQCMSDHGSDNWNVSTSCRNDCCLDVHRSPAIVQESGEEQFTVIRYRAPGAWNPEMNPKHPWLQTPQAVSSLVQSTDVNDCPKMIELVPWKGTCSFVSAFHNDKAKNFDKWAKPKKLTKVWHIQV